MDEVVSKMTPEEYFQVLSSRHLPDSYTRNDDQHAEYLAFHRKQQQQQQQQKQLERQQMQLLQQRQQHQQQQRLHPPFVVDLLCKRTGNSNNAAIDPSLFTDVSAHQLNRWPRDSEVESRRDGHGLPFLTRNRESGGFSRSFTEKSGMGGLNSLRPSRSMEFNQFQGERGHLHHANAEDEPHLSAILNGYFTGPNVKRNSPTHEPSEAISMYDANGPTDLSPPHNIPLNMAMAELNEESMQSGPYLPDSDLANLKRRRLNSSQLLLAMLSDGAVPTKHGSIPHPDSPNPRHLRNEDFPDVPLSISPFCKPRLHKDSLESFRKGESTSLTNTPIMFAEFFLGSDSGLDVKNMPPPPIFQNGAVETNNSALPATSTAGKLLDSNARADNLPEMQTPDEKPQPQEKKKPRRTKASKKNIDSNSSAPTLPPSANLTALSASIASQISASIEASSAKGEGFSIPNFASVMEASQTSQQNIHDWDRKFGLRRAHSKTMRESSRSRRKVLEFLKGHEAAALLGQIEASKNPPCEGTGPQHPPEEAENFEANNGLHDAMEADKVEFDNMQQTLDTTPRSPSLLFDADDVSIGSLSEPIEDHDEDHTNVFTVATMKQSSGDEELEKMFRRASLECVKSVPGDNPAAMPTPQEADRRQYHANSA